MRTFLRILLVIAFIGNGAWFYHDPGYEPALAILNALATLVTLIADATTNTDALGVVNKKVFKQRNGKHSTNYQIEGGATFTTNNHPPKNE
jgi:hypothetical protein